MANIQENGIDGIGRYDRKTDGMRGARTDDNQPEIVAALRKIGCSVSILAKVGGGVPDLVVGLANRNFLLEVKDGTKPPSERKLTPDQEKWHSEWRGQKAVVESVKDAMEVVTANLTN